MTTLVAITQRFREALANGTGTQPMSTNVNGSDDLPRAGVLIGLFEHDNGVVHVLLSQRSHRLTSQPGEVALPGGKQDPTDRDIIDCALRESNEEVGLPREHVQVLGVLGGAISRARLMVVPVVAIIPVPGSSLFPHRPSPDEVDAVFSMPFDLFLSSSHHWQHDSDWNGIRFHLHHFYYHSAPSLYYITPGSEQHVPEAVTSISSVPPHPRLTFAALSPSTRDSSSSVSVSASVPDVVVGSRAWTVWGLTAFILIKAATIGYGRAPAFRVQPPSILPIPADAPTGHINAIVKALSPSASSAGASPLSTRASAAAVASYTSAIPRSRL